MVRSKQTSRVSRADVPAPPADRIVASAPDVFGPTHPLYKPIAATTRLPDVLTRIVVQYASHLYPRQAHYAGNVVLAQSTDIKYTSSGAASSAASSSSSTTASSTPSASAVDSFSLRNRSWSMCGWMSRAVGGTPSFLLSVLANPRPSYTNSHVHLGYTCHPHGGPTNCFTAGFYANDLDLTPPAVDVDAHHEWEHWCVTLHCPQPGDGGSGLARRRLYRNGALMAEDACQPPDIDGGFTLLLGRYDPHHFQCLQGGTCDVRLYSRALEAGEINALYAGEERAEGSKEALEVWYKLDATDFDESVVRDSSGHGRHAAVDGALLQLSLTGGCNTS